MKRALYVILFLSWYLISLLPFWILYGISDALYVVAYHIWGYRKALVRKQLRDSFPEKSDSELLKIEKDYYLVLRLYRRDPEALQHITAKPYEEDAFRRRRESETEL